VNGHRETDNVDDYDERVLRNLQKLFINSVRITGAGLYIN
jgi:hypothetical protein